MLPFFGAGRAFKRGVWQVDCHELQLSEPSGETYSGAGYIGQRDGEIAFHVFGLGRLVYLHHHAELELSGSDIWGNTWRGIVQPGSLSPVPGYHASGKLTQLAGTASHLHSKPVFMAWVYQHIAIPGNRTISRVEKVGERIVSESLDRGAAEFESLGVQVQLSTGESELAVSASGDSLDLENGMDTKLLEALEFALGTDLNWSMLWRVAADKQEVFLRRLPTSMSGRVKPPLLFREGLDLPAVWSLVDQHIRCAVQLGQEAGQMSQLLAYIRRTCFYPRAYALALSVGVEEIVNGLTNECPVDPELARLIQVCKDALVEDGASGRPADSLQGILDQAGRVDRAINRLRDLAAKGRVLGDHVKAWITLRNTLVHPRKPWSIDEKSRHLMTCVEVLLNCLVLNMIDYRGPLTDYSRSDNPERTYPFPSAVTP